MAETKLQPGRPSVLTDDVLRLIRQALEDDPTMTCQQIAA